MSYSGNRGFPAGNPIANVLVIIVGALVVGASVVLGFVAFVILACLVLVLASVVGLRLWWYNRKLRKTQRTRSPDSQTKNGSTTIEGEYRVVDRRVRRD